MDHQQFVYKPDKEMRLADFDPNYTAGFDSKQAAQKSIREDGEQMAKYQNILMAHETNGLLIIFQAMDAAGKDVWKKRYRHINNYEEYLLDNGIHTLKFFLNLSKEEQRERLLERMKRTDKRWKFSADDLKDHEYWDEYMKVYEEAFEATSTDRAPWYIIPDNHRWFARAAAASIIMAKLKSLHSQYPTVGEKQKKKMAQAQKKLNQD